MQTLPKPEEIFKSQHSTVLPSFIISSDSSYLLTVP